jgi:Nucleotide modification associated domain 2
MTLHSYVVARDYGFAPNPFFGICTLATCKPIIRKAAKVGDWIVGTGSAAYGFVGRLVYIMKVDEILDYSGYWLDPRFQNKKPNLRGSLKQAYGDNIYHWDSESDQWIQENSHHSQKDGSANCANVVHDTQTVNVLIGRDFVFWGRAGPKIPTEFACVCAVRGHKSRFSKEFEDSFFAWIGSIEPRGYVGDPAEF